MKTITRSQYYQLLGLITAGKRQIDIIQAIERAAVEITDERNADGTPSDCGHTTDMIWQSRGLDEGLQILEIEVVPDMRQTTP